MAPRRRKVANTASGAALLKALEAYTPPDARLFDDTVIGRLLPAPARVLLAAGPIRRWLARTIERSGRGLLGGMVCRTRQLDDVTRTAMGEGARAVVILGAGLDTRAYRLPELAHVPVFEMDVAEIVEKKRTALARARVSTANVRFVTIDFETDDVAERLGSSGWDRTSRTLFLWEGVTQYVARDAVVAILRFVSTAAPGSEVAFTYVPQDVIEGRSARVGAEMARRFVARGLWVTGFDPAILRSELAAFGLDLTLDVGAADYQARYLAPRRRSLEVFEIERVAVARARGGPP